jgi:hypothetical protein
MLFSVDALAQASTGGGATGVKGIEKPLTNADVLALSKAGLDDDIVIEKIKEAPVEKLDISSDALLKLKNGGMSSNVIRAMVKRVSKRSGPQQGGPPIDAGKQQKPASSSSSPDALAMITDQEATRLIREGRYPQKIALQITDIKYGSPLNLELDRLIEEGYVSKYDRQTQRCIPTAKGTQYVSNAWGERDYCSSVQFVGFQSDVSGIVDKRATPERKAVTVIWEWAVSPTAYLERLKSLDAAAVQRSYRPDAFGAGGAPRLGTTKGSATFEKWEKGWKLSSINPYGE